MRETGGLAPRAPQETRRNCKSRLPASPALPAALLSSPSVRSSAGETHIQHGGVSERLSRLRRPLPFPRPAEVFYGATSAWSTPGAQGACD